MLDHSLPLFQIYCQTFEKVMKAIHISQAMYQECPESLLKRNLAQSQYHLFNDVMPSDQASNLTSNIPLLNQIQNCTSLKILSSNSFETDSDDE